MSRSPQDRGICFYLGALREPANNVAGQARRNVDATACYTGADYAMNFATRTTADALVSAGFIDNTCRPTTVYAAYNNLRGKKQMLNKPLMTHAFPPEWNELSMKLIQEHIAASRD